MGIEEILQRDSKYKYMLLGRMQSDCEYYLGFGNRKEIIFQPLQESLLFWCYRGLCLEIRPQVI